MLKFSIVFHNEHDNIDTVYIAYIPNTPKWRWWISLHLKKEKVTLFESFKSRGAFLFYRSWATPSRWRSYGRRWLCPCRKECVGGMTACWKERSSTSDSSLLCARRKKMTSNLWPVKGLILRTHASSHTWPIVKYDLSHWLKVLLLTAQTERISFLASRKCLCGCAVMINSLCLSKWNRQSLCNKESRGDVLYAYMHK